MCVYYLMYFYYLLLFLIHVLLLNKLRDLLMYLSLRVMHCISLNSQVYVRLQVSGLGSGFPIRQLLTTQPHILALPKYVVPTRSDNLLSDGTLYISHACQIVERARLKQYSKSIITLFLLNTHLRRFYLLFYILPQLDTITTYLYMPIQDSRNTTIACQTSSYHGSNYIM